MKRRSTANSKYFVGKDIIKEIASSSSMPKIEREINEERKFVIDFLALYQSLPSLWNISSADYSAKNVKREHYLILLEKYKEWDPRATLEDMKKKINNLRTNYRREMHRLANAPEGESSTLYYYNALDFLRHCEDVKPFLNKRAKIARISSETTKTRLSVSAMLLSSLTSNHK